MTCTDCGAPNVLLTAPGKGLCDPCFARAVDNLTSRIDAAAPDELDRVFVEGMRDLDNLV